MKYGQFEDPVSHWHWSHTRGDRFSHFLMTNILAIEFTALSKNI